MKGKKTSIQDKAKVIEAKINNPTKSTRDIEEETGVSKSAVNTIINEDLGQVGTESEAIASLIDLNDELLTLTALEMVKRVKSTPDEVRTGELVQVSKNSFDQNRLIQGKSTENVNVGSNLTKDQEKKLYDLWNKENDKQ